MRDADTGATPPGQVEIEIEIDSDVLAALHAFGDGWQARMNEALRDWLRMDERDRVASDSFV